MTKSKMKAAILRMVRERGNVTFVELGTIEGFKGKQSIDVAGHNIILWPECSPMAAEVLVEMLRSDKLRFDETPVMTYLIDGCSLKLPIAREPKPYASPHWLPVVFNLPRA